jgi:hypothetical protein
MSQEGRHSRIGSEVRTRILRNLGVENSVNPERTHGDVHTVIHDGDLVDYEWWHMEQNFTSRLMLEEWGSGESLIPTAGKIEKKHVINGLNRCCDQITSTTVYDRVKQDLLSQVFSQLEL